MYSNTRYQALQKYHGVNKRRYIILYISRIIMYFSKLIGISKWLENRLKKQKNTDVLFVFAEGTSEKRLGYIKNILNKNKIATEFSRLDKVKVQLLSLFLGAEKKTPLLLIGSQSLARYFIIRYKPKVIIISINCSVIPGVLRREINKKGGKLINIAHGTGYKGIAHTSSDFDYWLVFGQSTINGKLSNKKRIGRTEALIVGSPFLFGDQSQVDTNDEKNKNTILIASQWVPDRGIYPQAMRENRSMMLNFIQSNRDKDFFVKLHHLEVDDFWSVKAQEYANLSVYSRDISLYDALQKAYLCLHISSNASIEAGLMGVPSVTIDKYGFSTHLNIDQFLPVVTTSSELNVVFDALLENYSEYQQRAKAYANYMFGGFSCGAGLRISEHILTLLKTGKLENTQLIPDTDFLIEKASAHL